LGFPFPKGEGFCHDPRGIRVVDEGRPNVAEVKQVLVVDAFHNLLDGSIKPI
jgi:hypothetical protein